MRIAYVCYWNAYRRDGVAKKIEAQTDRWRSFGETVEIFCLTPAAPEPNDPVLNATLFPFDGFAGRIRATSSLARAVRRYTPDVIYLRYDLFLPPLWPALSRFPVVMEINDFPTRHSLRSLMVRWYEGWNRGRLLTRSDGLICIAQEIAESPRLAGFRWPRAVIGNSIEVEVFPAAAAPRNERPRGVFLGSPDMVRNGIDKIRFLATHLPGIDFELIGPTERELGGDIPANLFVHGFLDREQYEPIAMGADFAIGSLALHRLGIGETSPLKLREYLAYGLPLILAQKDPDLTGRGLWFVLELPNCESNVVDHLEDIRRFVESVRGSRVPRETVIELVGAETKERQRLAFIGKTVSSQITAASPS